MEALVYFFLATPTGLLVLDGVLLSLLGAVVLHGYYHT